MADPSMQQLVAQVDRLATQLDERARRYRLLSRYEDGPCPFPPVVQAAKLTRAYRLLMPVAETPWGSLVTGSVLDRLEVAGIRSGDDAADEAVWGLWQDNTMDAESKLAHAAALLTGRAYALVWPEPGDDSPSIQLDSSEQMIVQYVEGSRRRRVAALRRWISDDKETTYATLYRPEAIYKFQTPQSGQRAEGDWAQRQVDGEPWPLPNPFTVVPVVELAVNRKLKPGQWGWARGEYENCVGLIDRINLLTFLGLVVAFWLGFPLRGVVGDRILRDDEGEVIPPFDSDPGSIIQLENPDAKLVEYKAADRSNLSVYDELSQLAAITKTPRHYFPEAHSMSHVSADAIRADEGALNAKVTDHKGSIGEGWEEVLRLGGMMLSEPVDLSPRAELVWKNHESRSLAEMADAANKLQAILPTAMIAEMVLNMTQEEIARMQAERATDALSQLIAGVNTSDTATAPAHAADAAPAAAAANGAGP